MNPRTILLLTTVTLFAACTTSTITTAVDPEISDYRRFLSDLSTQLHEVNAVGFDDGKVSELLRLHDEVGRMLNSTSSFSEMDGETYTRFVSLTQEMYQRMCSDSRLVDDRARLYDMLMNPGSRSRVASL